MGIQTWKIFLESSLQNTSSLKDSKNVPLFDLGIPLLWKLTDQFMCKDVHMFTTHHGKITEAAQNMQIHYGTIMEKKKKKDVL